MYVFFSECVLLSYTCVAIGDEDKCLILRQPLFDRKLAIPDCQVQNEK